MLYKTLVTTHEFVNWVIVSLYTGWAHVYTLGEH